MDPVIDATHLLGAGDGDGTFLRKIFFNNILVILIETVDALGNEGSALADASNLSTEVETCVLHKEGVGYDFAIKISSEANLD